MDEKKVYTKAGDGGYTKTLKNVRISKSDALIELIGSLEEAYAAAVAVKVSTECSEAAVVCDKIKAAISEIQGAGTFITADSVTSLERLCDETASAVLDEPTNRASAEMYKAYTLLRRAERAAVKVGQFGRFNKYVLAYMNRLCSFALAVCQKLESEDTRQAVHIPEKKEITINTEVVKMAVPAQSDKVLTLTLAKEIAMAIEHMASERGKAIVVAILDEGTNPILIHAMDGSFIASVDIALNKAYTAASLKMPTHEALELSKEGGALYGLTNGGRILMLGGGYPLMLDGVLCGGLAVSGSTAEEDTEFAAFGAKYFEVKMGK